MSADLFNTTFEISLRLLLLLSVSADPLDLDTLVCLDLFVTNAKEYGFGDENLNGDGLCPRESAGHRRKVFRAGIAELSGQGLINVVSDKNGISYSINLFGQIAVGDFDSDYAKEYEALARRVLAACAGVDRRVLLRKAGYYGRDGK